MVVVACSLRFIGWSLSCFTIFFPWHLCFWPPSLFEFLSDHSSKSRGIQYILCIPVCPRFFHKGMIPIDQILVAQNYWIILDSLPIDEFIFNGTRGPPQITRCSKFAAARVEENHLFGLRRFCTYTTLDIFAASCHYGEWHCGEFHSAMERFSEVYLCGGWAD